MSLLRLLFHSIRFAHDEYVADYLCRTRPLHPDIPFLSTRARDSRQIIERYMAEGL